MHPCDPVTGSEHLCTSSRRAKSSDRGHTPRISYFLSAFDVHGKQFPWMSRFTSLPNTHYSRQACSGLYEDGISMELAMRHRKDQAHGHRHSLDPGKSDAALSADLNAPRPPGQGSIASCIQGTGARCTPGCRDRAGPVPGTRRVPAAAATLQSLELRGIDEGLQRAASFQRSCACSQLVLELSNLWARCTDTGQAKC